MQAQGTIMPSLTLEMLRVVSGSQHDPRSASTTPACRARRVPGFVIPTDRNGQLWVHFAPHDKARYVSAVDVLEGRVPADRVAQRLVLIGTSAVGLLDIKTTPVDPAMPGVEVHAQVLENVLTNSVLSHAELCDRRRTVRRASSRLCHHLAGADARRRLLLLLFGATRRAHRGRLVVLLTAQQPADRFHLSAAVELPHLSHAGVQQLSCSEQAQRRRIRSAFGQYLSPALVEQLAQSPEKLVLGGEDARHDASCSATCAGSPPFRSCTRTIRRD